MLSITATKREPANRRRKKVEALRKKGFIPSVLYGPKIESSSLQVISKEFEKIYKEAGESTLINLETEGKEVPVLIYEVQRDPLSGETLHVDFYQPDLTKEVEVEIPLVFEGEAPAVAELGGTLIHTIQEVEVRALPQNLPHEIKINVESLNTFEDRILIKDLLETKDVEVLQDPEDVVAQVVPAEDVEKELEAPLEEDVEGVKKVEREEKEEEEGAAKGEVKPEGEGLASKDEKPARSGKK
ncbi:50S ribosomal protein L25 [Patescibacteria group bacterium]|nr:50S ribosomal protein L25 [Patescibacteria group bacterium]